ncbi:hypothetical protein L1049_006771 [Liquidambar formosana]|uniref:F-box/kelch-repeat protein SKIP25 n=1 Tax=Liquidambar formosana TaxID=63359 RepID=A0AAP0RHI9_LIQFO
MPNAITPATTSADPTTRSATKRRKRTGRRHHQHQQQPLLPGLPDHIAQLCLSSLPPSLLYSVCSSWRRLIYSPSFPPFLSIYALFSSSKTLQNHTTSIEFSSFDPISSKWHRLPPPPHDPPLRLLLRHPSFISRNLPIQTVAVSGQLILLAATTHHFLPALSRPLVFNPLSQKWAFGPQLAAPRRWCAAGASRGAVYVASGIGSQYSIDVARSVEKWDLQNNNNIYWKWEWQKMRMLKDGRFSRDAIDAVGCRGKLYMVNVKGDAAKEGVVYDVENDSWEEMPEGLIAGWRGPAAAMDEEVMYVVDEAKGALRRYDPERDGWEEIIESERLKGAEQIAAGGGRVCVVCGGGITVIDLVASPPRIWVVDSPPGFQPVAVHILPRMNGPDHGEKEPRTG